MADVSMEKIDTQIKEHEAEVAKLKDAMAKLDEKQAQLNKGRMQATALLNSHLGAIASLKKLKGEIDNIEGGLPTDGET